MLIDVRPRSRGWRPALGAALVVAAAWPAASGGQSTKWPSSSQPRPLQSRDLKFPPYQLRALANGLTVVVVPHDEQPMVSMRLLVRAGAAQDPPGKYGVAAMVAALLDQGTASRTAQQVADTIDFAGGDLTTGAVRDLSFANVTVTADRLGLGMDLLADVIRRPVFAEEELDRQRAQALSVLRVRYQDPEYVADVVFDRLVFGAHPYGFPAEGTPSSIEALTRDDLARFHGRYYAPNNCILAIVGDATVEQAMSAAGSAFGDWPRREIAAEPFASPPRPARRVVVLDKPDAVQTEIRMGHVGIRRKTRDFLPVGLAVRILGGEGANRMYRVLRHERGLAYAASVDSDTLKHSGVIVARTSTRPETAAEAVRVAVDQFWQLQRERVGDEELSAVKSYMVGHFPLTVETPNDIASQVLEVLFYELPPEELQTFRRRVEEVSVDDVERAALGYLQPGSLSAVLVGDASRFVDQLKRAGIGRVEVVRFSDLDVTATGFTRKEPTGGPTAASGGRH